MLIVSIYYSESKQSSHGFTVDTHDVAELPYDKNVEEILHQSNELFDKFVIFAETFVKFGADIDRLQQDFNRAKGQLNEGKGNIVRRLEGLKILGISPKKQIPESL